MCTMRAGPALRLTHAAVFAAVCVLVSGLGHSLSAGTAVPPEVLGGGFLVMCWAGWWLTQGEPGVAVVAGSSALGQIALHGLFGLAHPRPSVRDVPPHAGGGLHPAGAGSSPHPPAAGTSSEGVSLLGVIDASMPTSGMFWAHVLAGLVCGWWLWRGQAAVFQLGRSLGMSVSGCLRFAWRARLVVPFPVPPRGATPPRTQRCAPQRLALHEVSRRGPPVLAA
jgi:hypothetical protein